MFKRSVLFLAGILIVAILFVRLFSFYTQKTFINKEGIDVKITLLTEPQVQGRFQKFTLHSRGQRIYITLPSFPRYSYGDEIEIRGTIEERILDNKRHILTMFYPQITLIDSKPPGVIRLARFFRSNIVNLYNSTLSQTGSSLLSGIVLGVKENMPDDFSDDLRYVGLIHIIAASGMNVTMVAGTLLFLTAKFFNRRLAILISISGIFFYALIAGFEPSILRAAVMSSIAGIAAILGKQNFALISLILTCFVMIIIDQGMVNDIGFALSVASTAGIITIKPKLDGLFKNNHLRIPADDLSTTMSAQIATMPIILTVFGQYGLLSLPVNFLVLWTVPPLMIIGALGGVTGLIFPLFGKLILFASIPLLVYIEYIVRFAGRMNSSIELSNFPLPFSIAYYLMLISFILLMNKKH